MTIIVEHHQEEVQYMHTYICATLIVYTSVYRKEVQSFVGTVKTKLSGKEDIWNKLT